MNVTMLLADSAQAINSKLYILGGGWSIIDPDGAPIAIAIKIEVPWNEANIRHKLRLELVDQDGRQVTVPTPMGDQPVTLRSEFETGRPPGIIPGVPLDVALAINLAAIQLQPSSRYIWRCYINDAKDPDAEAGFSTRAARNTTPASNAS